MAEKYIEGVRELMAAYNESSDAALYDALHALCYAPNEETLRENYERNSACYTASYDAPALPAYDVLPVLLFPVTDAYSVLFDKAARRFLLDGTEGASALLQSLLFADMSDIAAAAKRYRRTCDDARAHTLAQDIENAIAVQDFGAAAQRTAGDYHALCPHGEIYEIFHAEAALFYADLQSALRYGAAAYEKRKMSARVCGLLSRIYHAAGEIVQAVKYQILSAERTELSLPHDPVLLAACLRAITAADSDMRYAPFVHRATLADGAIRSDFIVPLAEEMLRFSEDLPCYWTGIYNPYGQMHVRSRLLSIMNAAMEEYGKSIYGDVTFDLMKAKEQTEVLLAPQEGAPVLVPIAVKNERQTVCFKEAGNARSMVLARGEFAFYRIEQPTCVQSKELFAVGSPVVLRHSPRRRKIVLNLLADGLSWQEVRRGRYSLVPNLMKFFQKGVIFNHHFSGSEYTYPSLASIETGLYQHHTQIAEPGAPFVLSSSYVTLSEQMKRLGYYCVNLMGCSDAVYNGISRGYDRLIVNPWVMRAADGVERLIRHIEAFDACDNFVLLHFADTHPNNFDIPSPVKAQTHLCLEDVLQEQDARASVFLKPNVLSQYVNHAEIQAMDRQLGYLFDYLTSHYEDDEYIVLLYSDHGASVHARSPYLLSEEQTGAALMVRGAGVPALGCVDELASSVDIYKILGKLAGYPIDAPYLDGNLPEAFGGTRRTYTVSNSIYPGQTYKICVRTERHAFHLETEELTREDGTVSFARYKYHIHERNEDYCEVFDDRLARGFLDIVWQYTESFRR